MIGRSLQENTLWVCAAVIGLTAFLGGSLQAADYALVGAKIYPSPDVPSIESGTIIVLGDTILVVGDANEVAIPDGSGGL